MNDFENFEVNDFPDITTIDFKSIQKKYFRVIVFNILIVFLIVFLALFFLIKFKLQEEIPEYISYFYILYFIVFPYVLLISFFGFKKRKYAVREKDISYKSGFFFKKVTTVPFSRIQHIEVEEGVFSRIYNLASLSVYTAGDSSDDLDIGGLNKEEALKIKEFISQKINE